jgi:hypothetical protein
VEHGETSYAVALLGKGQDKEKDVRSKGKMGNSSNQSLLMKNYERKETQCSARDQADNVGADIMHMHVVEGKFQLEKLKTMLTSIKEEAKKWLGQLDMGCMREENYLDGSIEGPIIGPIKEGASAGNNIGLESMEVGLRRDKSKQPIEVQNPNNFSNRQVQHVNSVYSHRPQST